MTQLFEGLTTVVNIKTHTGNDYEFIGRPSLAGNPFVIGRDGTRHQVIAKFAQYFIERMKDDSDFRAYIVGLKGKKLGCFCKPLACHGDIIATYLDSHFENTTDK